MSRFLDDQIDDFEDSGAGWSAVAWTGGAVLALAVLAVIASLT